MSPVPASALTFADGEVTLVAALLAPNTFDEFLSAAQQKG